MASKVYFIKSCIKDGEKKISEKAGKLFEAGGFARCFKKGDFTAVKVHIGDENRSLGFDGCTLITANYNIEDIKGALGIIGPMRMEYERVIPTVNYVAESISRLLNEIL